jgi:DNA-binding MarR family transcriptional regulator
MDRLPGSDPPSNSGVPRSPEPIGTIEMELLTLVRNLETLGRRSALYRQVDRAGYLALRTLDRLGPVPTNVLADALHLDASTITRQVTALVEDKLVERRPNPADRRSSDLAITELGLAVMAEVGDERQRVLSELFSGWTDHDRRNLGRSLTKLNGSLLERMATPPVAPYAGPDPAEPADADAGAPAEAGVGPG